MGTISYSRTRYKPTQHDLSIERQLAEIFDKINGAKNKDEKRKLWRAYSLLHAKRSAQMIEHLERARGLFRHG